jgi:hypothetical protein
MQEQDTLQIKALETFQENLLFLQKTDAKLFEKIASLNLAIEKGYYKERYTLEYKDEGYFDVKEESSGKYLYGQDSNKYAKLAAESIDFSKKDNLFETFYNVSVDKSYIKELESKDISRYSYAAAASLISYHNEHASKETTMIKLYKFIFFGTGLATHLTTIHEKLQSNVYFIIEDDLELFRLSLFVTKYSYLAENGAQLIFSVFDEDDIFTKKAQLFLYTHFIYNHYIKFFHMLSHKEDKIHKIQNLIAGQTYLTFNFSALMTSLLRPLEYLSKGYRLLDIGSSYKDTILTQKPVLLLGAGPSFDKNISWLQKNHKKFIIVAVSALMAKLEDLEIKPDIITHVHGFADALPHIQKVKDMSFFDTSIALFGGMSYPPFVEYFKKENVFIFEGSSRYKDGYSGITSSNIGALSAGLLFKMDIKDMYLLGLDFAFDQETGQTHADIHSHTRNIKIDTKSHEKELGGGIMYKDELIETEGNFQEKVYTTLLFNDMKSEFISLSEAFNKETTIYNLSDGALIKETLPLHTDDEKITRLPEIDKMKLYKDLHHLFMNKSSDTLTEKEIKNIEEKIQYYDEILEVLQKHLEQPNRDLNHYHYNLLGTFYNILTDSNEDTHSSDMNYIITLYLQFISGYIFDLINTKEIKSEKQLIKHIDKFVIPQTMRIIKFFKEEMQKHLHSIKKKNEM